MAALIQSGIKRVQAVNTGGTTSAPAPATVPVAKQPAAAPQPSPLPTAARGDHHPASDWDLLVIAELPPDRPREPRRALKSGLPRGTRGATAVLAATPEEFEGNLFEIYLDIALDGCILYDQAGYAAGKLAELRRVIEKSRVYRERAPAGDVWKWRTPPQHPWSVEWER